MTEYAEGRGRESNLQLRNPSWSQPTRDLLVNIRESFLTEFCQPHCAGILRHLNMNCQLCVAFYSPKHCSSHFGIFTCHVSSLYVALEASFAFVNFVEPINVTTVVQSRFTRGSNTTETTASPSPVDTGGSCETGFGSSTGGNIKLSAATVFTKGTHSLEAVRGRGF